jgi:hypothetical protein
MLSRYRRSLARSLLLAGPFASKKRKSWRECSLFVSVFAVLPEGVSPVRFLRALKTALGILAIVFVGLTMTLLIGLPIVINRLADVLGTGAELPQHWIPAIIIDLILLALAYFWVWKPWRQYSVEQKAQGLIVRKGQGRAYMDAESVRQQVYAAVMKVPDVQRADVTISNDLGRAVVQLSVLTENTIHGPKKKQEISREAKKVVEDQLGIRLAGEPIINMSLAPISGEGLQVAKPFPSPRAVTAESREPAAAAAPAPVQPVPPGVEPLDKPKPSPVEPEETEEASTLILKPEAESKADEQTPPAAGDTGGSAASGATTPPKPFVRRPFTPPSGSARLPDLPPIPVSKPPSEAKAPAKPDEPTDEDMPSLESLTDEEDKEDKKDQATSDS